MKIIFNFVHFLKNFNNILHAFLRKKLSVVMVPPPVPTIVDFGRRYLKDRNSCIHVEKLQI
jgi:hypothetical protein